MTALAEYASLNHTKKMSFITTLYGLFHQNRHKQGPWKPNYQFKFKGALLFDIGYSNSFSEAHKETTMNASDDMLAQWECIPEEMI